MADLQPDREVSRDHRWQFLRDWPRAIKYFVIAQYWNVTFTSIMLGGLCDAYLLIEGGSNSFVGVVESARGMTALAVALPLGWAGDKFPKTKILALNLFIGLCASSLLLAGIPLDLMPLTIAGCVGYSIHNQCCFGLLPPLASDLVQESGLRTRMMSHLQTAASLGNASGPLVQLLAILVLGNNGWTATELHWVLCFGIVFFFFYVPSIWRGLALASVSLSIQTDTADERGTSMTRIDSSASVGSDLSRSMSRGDLSSSRDIKAATLSSRQRWILATLIELSTLTTAIGSGMTFKYWPLFFKGDFHFSPAGVCGIQFSIWLAIAGTAQLAPKLSERFGRLRVVITLHVLGTFFLFLISRRFLGVLCEVPLVLLRNAIMNGGSPLIQAIILDLVPKEHRGKWSSLASLRRMTWSGSAFVGGILSDTHDYRFAFFVTACVHTLSGCVLIVVSFFSWRFGRDQSGQIER